MTGMRLADWAAMEEFSDLVMFCKTKDRRLHLIWINWNTMQSNPNKRFDSISILCQHLPFFRKLKVMYESNRV